MLLAAFISMPRAPLPRSPWLPALSGTSTKASTAAWPVKVAPAPYSRPGPMNPFKFPRLATACSASSAQNSLA